jgi:hypothetical protein
VARHQRRVRHRPGPLCAGLCGGRRGSEGPEVPGGIAVAGWIVAHPSGSMVDPRQQAGGSQAPRADLSLLGYRLGNDRPRPHPAINRLL